MPSGKFSKDNPLSDILPLEGAFISAFLPDAPPLFVKVYIYCLYLCIHPELTLDTPSKMANAIGCPQDELTAALKYWSDLQLINYSIRPFTIEMNSAFHAARQNNSYAGAHLNIYKDYFAALRSFFSNRNLTTSDYDKARDWLEVYGLPQEVALMLVSHCIASKDTNISFTYIDKVALTWANEDIKSTDAAENYLRHYEARQHEAGKLLLHLGIKRTPSMDEIKLYEKWTKKLGFSDKAILAACEETTKTNNPTFAYLDKIIGTLNQLELKEAKDIRKHLAASNSEMDLITLLLHELGLRAKSSTPEYTAWIKKFAGAGFTNDALVFVAKGCARDSIRTFKGYLQRMLWWQEKNIFTVPEMDKYLVNHPAGIYTKPTDQKQQIKQTNAHIVDKHENIDFNKLYADLDSLEDLV